MNSRCRRMDPAQSLCGHELLWSQRPSDENIRVCDFLCYAVVVFKLKKVKIRKSGLQLIAKPWRRMPELKAMMVHDEDFHLFVAALQTARVHSSWVFCSCAYRTRLDAQLGLASYSQ